MLGDKVDGVLFRTSFRARKSTSFANNYEACEVSFFPTETLRFDLLELFCRTTQVNSYNNMMAF